MPRTDLYGSVGNRKQGTQEPSKAKRKPASDYGRSSQRAAPTGNTEFPDSWREYRSQMAAKAGKKGFPK